MSPLPGNQIFANFLNPARYSEPHQHETLSSDMAQAPLSPSHSPRLPSPPPFPEVQIGPKSPGLPGAVGGAGQDAETDANIDAGATRRIRPGTRALEMASGPPLIPLSELDSSFQLQEHLKSLYLQATRSSTDSEDYTTVPINRESATLLATPPDGVDRALWLYELCRLLVQRANALIVGFFADTPPCSAQNCPEMRASEWQYLCAVHDPPKSCCAIDYCCHTLDWAANVLTSQKHFPSRLSLGGDAPGGSQASVRQLTNIFRRVYRMFAHAWFQHRDVFWSLEGQEGLYVFYKTVCDVYQLVPEENYTVPAEAERGALSPEKDTKGTATDDSDTPLSRIGSGEKELETAATEGGAPQPSPPQTAQTQEEGDVPTSISTGATTRRHKQTPSLGSFVTTIAEGDEEGEDVKVTTSSSTQIEAPPALPSLVAEPAMTMRRDRSLSPPKRLPENATQSGSQTVPEISVKEVDEQGKKVEKQEEDKEAPAPAESQTQTAKPADAPATLSEGQQENEKENVKPATTETEDGHGKEENTEQNPSEDSTPSAPSESSAAEPPSKEEEQNQTSSDGNTGGETDTAATIAEAPESAQQDLAASGVAS